MKVLLINSVCGVGSTGKICVDLAKLIVSQGDECVIAYGRGIAKGYDRTYKITSSLGNKFHFLKSRIFDKHGLGNALETKKFIKFIKEYNPDVIHLHNIHGYYLNYKILFEYLKTYEGKVVWTMHDMWPVTGHCACTLDCTKWQNKCHSCTLKNEYPKTILSRAEKNYFLKKDCFSGVKNMTIVTVSNWLKSEFEKSFLSNYEIKVLNNGIDLNLFCPTESDFRKINNLEDKKVLLAVADRWVERKGYYDFIKLSNLLDDDTKLVMVGLTEEQKNSLPSNILGITRTDNQKQLIEIYTAADLFVNLTYSDNFPTVNLESLACGTPVLTYKTGGSPEMLTGKTGFVVEQKDIEGVAKIIKDYKKTPEIKKECISQAKNYDKNLRFNEYLKLYK